VQSLCKPKKVDGTEHIRLGCLHGVTLVVNGRRRGRQVVNAIYFDVERKGDVVAHDFEVFVVQKVSNILSTARVKVVNTEDFVALGEETLAQMRAKETCSTCYQYSITHG
jgi:hypothetical protein